MKAGRCGCSIGKSGRRRDEMPSPFGSRRFNFPPFLLTPPLLLCAFHSFIPLPSHELAHSNFSISCDFRPIFSITCHRCIPWVSVHHAWGEGRALTMRYGLLFLSLSGHRSLPKNEVSIFFANLSTPLLRRRTVKHLDFSTMTLIALNMARITRTFSDQSTNRIRSLSNANGKLWMASATP